MACLPSIAVFLVSLLLLCGDLQLIVGSTASDYSYSFYGKTYRFSAERKTGDDARKQCTSELGSLVDIRSKEELAHLTGAIRNLVGAYHPRHLGIHYLVGGIYKPSTSDAEKGTWHYESGGLMTYTNWINYNFDAKRQCATIFYLYNNDHSYWYDVDCSWPSHYDYICAREVSGAFKYGFYGNLYYVPSGGSSGFTGVANARKKCSDHEGSLVDIKSSEELLHILRVIRSKNATIEHASTWLYAIGGKKVNGSWIYEDGTRMKYANWIPGEEGKDGCAVLDPLAVTTPSGRNYRVVPCDNVHFNYSICSKKVTGESMQITGEYVEGHGVKWICTSYTTDNYTLEFRVRSTDPTTRTTVPWGLMQPHSWKYFGWHPVNTYILPFTSVTQRKLQYVHTAHRSESGLLASCGRKGAPFARLEAYTINVAYAPLQTVITDTKNLIEGKLHVITVTVAECFPQSYVHVEFQAKHNISHKQNSNTKAYPGFIAVSTITFVPHRSDNGTSITVRVKNYRFPEKDFGKSEIVQVHVLFEPKGETKSTALPETQVGIQTEHIIGFFVGLLCLLCAALALIVYIRLRGVKMCPSSGTPPRQAFVDEMSTFEAPPNQRRGITVPDGSAPIIPHDDVGEPVVCEYDTSELPQYEPIVVVGDINDTPISAAVCGNMPPPETFVPDRDNTSAQLVLNEPYDVVQDRSSCYNTTNPNTYDIVVDETPLPP